MKINEIFCSIQGEGHFTGKPAVFIRTSGCNLHCPFCDTQHHDGQELGIEAIVEKASRFAPRHAIITGGEPSLQTELESLAEALHQAGFYIQIETNGTRLLPPSIDWVTCSPKKLSHTVITNPNEVKVVFEGQDMDPYDKMFQAQVWSLQPCDTGDVGRNQVILKECIRYVMQHPKWSLSLQTHKLIGIE